MGHLRYDPAVGPRALACFARSASVEILPRLAAYVHALMDMLFRLRLPARALLLGLCLCINPWLIPVVAGQTAENVAIVINENSSSSQRIGEYYTRKHALPSTNVIRIKTSTEEIIDRLSYLTTIETPIAAALSRQNLQDRILYLVLTKGVPLRVSGTNGVQGSTASVDSELTLLYRRMTGQNAPIPGRIDNPYFLGTRGIDQARLFSHREQDIYLVARIDAFTVEEALALVDKATAPTAGGRVVLDERDALIDHVADDWLSDAAARLSAQGVGDRVVLEKTVKPVSVVQQVIGYYSWGSNDPQNRRRKTQMGFVPGALAATYVSSDARTFHEPPSTWTPSDNWKDRSSLFEGSPQSLIGDLIREGATGVAGHVTEPFLQSTIRPNILFPAYFAGFNLVESFYLAMPYLSWQTVVIGDPLCAPFPRKALTRADIDAGMDPEMRAPAFFAKYALDFLTKSGLPVPRHSLELSLRGQFALNRGDFADAAQSFEGATELAPRLIGSQMQLALLYDRAGKFDAAIDRYRRILDMQPNLTVALNNLAYALAVHRNAPGEALPFAQRAVATAPDDPNLLDTLGWVQHIGGDERAAAATFEKALRVKPRSAEIHLHAATVFAANKQFVEAKRELDASLELDPSFKGRADARELAARIEKSTQ
jgi:uncharacterized protein (TIGR03790 family)